MDDVDSTPPAKPQYDVDDGELVRIGDSRGIHNLPKMTTVCLNTIVTTITVDGRHPVGGNILKVLGRTKNGGVRLARYDPYGLGGNEYRWTEFVVYGEDIDRINRAAKIGIEGGEERGPIASDSPEDLLSDKKRRRIVADTKPSPDAGGKKKKCMDCSKEFTASKFASPKAPSRCPECKAKKKKESLEKLKAKKKETAKKD